MLDISNNQSWRLDNSWEFVMWDKSEEERLLASNASKKFPVPQGGGSPNNNSGVGGNLEDTMTPSEEALNNNNPNLNLHRFSRYDNLEGRLGMGKNSRILTGMKKSQHLGTLQSGSIFFGLSPSRPNSWTPFK